MKQLPRLTVGTARARLNKLAELGGLVFGDADQIGMLRLDVIATRLLELGEVRCAPLQVPLGREQLQVPQVRVPGVDLLVAHPATLRSAASCRLHTSSANLSRPWPVLEAFISTLPSLNISKTAVLLVKWLPTLAWNHSGPLHPGGSLKAPCTYFQVAMP